MVDAKLDTNQCQTSTENTKQTNKKQPANWTISRKAKLADLRNLFYPLYLALVKLDLEYCIQFWVPQIRNNTEKPEMIQRRHIKIVVGTEHMIHEVRLRKTG